MKAKVLMVMIILVTIGFAGNSSAESLSIYQIQHSTDQSGDSPLNGEIVGCLGGIVTHIRPGSRPRLIIQDSYSKTGWNAIQVKGWVSDAFDGVNIGDRISLENVLVEENKGTTFLQYKSENNASFVIVDINNPIPEPLLVSIAEVNAPDENIDSVVVNSRNAEKYESVLIKVVNVYVQDLGHGKAYDNYLLTSNANPNLTCWASDYMNADTNGDIYHPYVVIGESFCAVSGILEQYTGDSEGICYDYYQLLTINTESFPILHIADLDGDGDVDFDDNEIFGTYWRLYEGK
jgi:hypothetical protein